MTRRDDRGRFVAERTTRETTRTVTERFTVHSGGDDTLTDTLDPLPWVAGWGNGPDLLNARHQHRQHLETQQARCLDFLWDAVVSAEMTAEQGGSWDTFAHQLPELTRRAIVILTAGPEATPLELTTGRSL